MRSLFSTACNLIASVEIIVLQLRLVLCPGILHLRGGDNKRQKLKFDVANFPANYNVPFSALNGSTYIFLTRTRS